MPSKPGDIYYTADFNAPLEGWEEYLVDARSLKVIAGDPSKYRLTTDEAHLLVELEKTFTWLYLAYSPITLDDVRIDATVENLGRNSNNVSLICRYSDLGWYEFNIANSGIYNILRYDTKSRNYFTLYTGGSKNIKMGAETNQYTGICKGDELTLLINDVETRTTSDRTLGEGKAGISFSSFNVLPITLELTEFVLTFP
jgi:hypothetical protein